MHFLLSFLFMHDTFMLVELSNVTFNLFINNIFRCCKIILEYFILVNIQSNRQTIQQHGKT
jgi:hypothetical protein